MLLQEMTDNNVEKLGWAGVGCPFGGFRESKSGRASSRQVRNEGRWGKRHWGIQTTIDIDGWERVVGGKMVRCMGRTMDEATGRPEMKW